MDFLSADPLPALVAAAHERADSAGFTLSCEPAVGVYLSRLAAAVPRGGKILELGTGAGVGLAWIVHGLGARTDARVTSIDLDPATQALASRAAWPAHVELLVGDGADLVGQLGELDLIFADAPGGKLVGLERTIGALAPHGVLLVDDMDLALHSDPALRAALVSVRDQLLASDVLDCVELPEGSGMIVATRRS